MDVAADPTATSASGKKEPLLAGELQAAREGASGGLWLWVGACCTRDGERKAEMAAVTNQSISIGRKTSRKMAAESTSRRNKWRTGIFWRRVEARAAVSGDVAGLVRLGTTR
ncbi:hypothetical protein PIB30_092519 [Stylosanthes scabra]|uniref:Uncharacterized protein n=1 Tax=Stylosanthes scabra TaxID=79078 RepID=A0ABU6TX73_9FABA|nr:hypothetical protein [Stylosanthes scabra]